MTPGGGFAYIGSDAMEINFNLGAVDVPDDLRGRFDDDNAHIVSEVAASDELARVAARWGRYLQSLATLAFGAVLVIVLMLILGGDEERWVVIGPALGLIGAFGIGMLMFRRAMARTYRRLLLERLDS